MTQHKLPKLRGMKKIKCIIKRYFIVKDIFLTTKFKTLKVIKLLGKL